MGVTIGENPEFNNTVKMISHFRINTYMKDVCRRRLRMLQGGGLWQGTLGEDINVKNKKYNQKKSKFNII